MKEGEIRLDFWHGARVFEIVHRISVADASAHLLGVSSTFRLPSGGAALPSPFTLFMPTWTPGSYLVREYARHVERFTALADGKPATHRKVRKNAWEIAHAGARVIEVRYQLYANDLTVRTNHVDTTTVTSLKRGQLAQYRRTLVLARLPASALERAGSPEPKSRRGGGPV